MPSSPSQQFLTYSSLQFVLYWRKLLIFLLRKIDRAIFQGWVKLHISVVSYSIDS